MARVSNIGGWQWAGYAAAEIVYQLIVVAFVGAGGFGDIYHLLGWPWSDVGLENVVHTSLCWAIVEVPAAYITALIWRRERRKMRGGCPGPESLE